MAQYLVIALALLSIVTINEVSGIFEDPYLEEYDPFKPKTKTCTAQESGGSCFSRQSSSKTSTTVTKEQSKYTEKQVWKHKYFGNAMTASVGEYINEKEVRRFSFLSDESFQKDKCRRVIVFSVRGVILDGNDVVGTCKSEDPFQQLIFIENALWYYPSMRIKLDSSGEQVIVVKKSKGLCEKKYYKIEGQRSRVKEEKEKTETMDQKTAVDEDCQSLFNGETGTFNVLSTPPDSYNAPVVSWGANVLNEPNFWIKFVKYSSPFCHVKLIVSYFGSDLTGTAMFCGDYKDTVVTEQGVYFGKNIVAKVSQTDPAEVTVLIDPRNGECIKHKFTFTNTAKGVKNQYQSTNFIHELDQECKEFKEGKLTQQQINSEWVASVKASLEEDKVDVVPHYIETLNIGPQLTTKYNLDDLYIHGDFNTGKDMGVLVLQYTIDRYFVILVAKGVVIDVAFSNRVPTLTIQQGLIICDELLSFKRDLKDENLFYVLAKWDESYCTRSRFVLIKKDNKLQRQEIFPAQIGVSDSECRELIRRGVKPNNNSNDSQYEPSVRVLRATNKVESDLMAYVS